MNEIYIKSVSKRAKLEVKHSTAEIIILSPYLTSTTAEKIISSAPRYLTNVYTLFSAENFSCGASSINTLISLLKLNYKIYHLPKLHAKIILTSNILIVGSQNLTSAGTKNKEASALILDQKLVQKTRQDLKGWLLHAQPITLEMALELRNALPKIARKYRKLGRECISIDSNVFEAQKRRDWSAKTLVEINKSLYQQSELLRSNVGKLSLSSLNKIRARIYKLSYDNTRYNPFSYSEGTYTTLKITSDSPNQNFLSWGKDTKLVKRKRYLMIALDTGRLAWPALNKTQLTQFGTAVTGITSLNLAGFNLRVDFQLTDKLEDLQTWNVKIVFRVSSRKFKIVLYSYFNLSELIFEHWEIENDDHTTDSQHILNALQEKENLAATLLELLIKPFKYEANRNGLSPDIYLKNLGNNYIIRLHYYNDNPFFTIKAAR